MELVLGSRSTARPPYLYLLPIKFFKPSMSPSKGRRKPEGSSPSQNRLARLLPIISTNATCSGSHVSNVVDLTLDICVPRERCMPEQFRQTNTPRLTEAQVGPRAWQSAHLLLSSCLSSSCRIRLWLSFCALVTLTLLFVLVMLPDGAVRSKVAG